MFNDNPQPPIDPPTMNVAECDVEQFVESLLKDLVNESDFGDELHGFNIEEVS